MWYDPRGADKNRGGGGTILLLCRWYITVAFGLKCPSGPNVLKGGRTRRAATSKPMPSTPTTLPHGQHQRACLPLALTAPTCSDDTRDSPTAATTFSPRGAVGTAPRPLPTAPISAPPWPRRFPPVNSFKITAKGHLNDIGGIKKRGEATIFMRRGLVRACR